MRRVMRPSSGVIGVRAALAMGWRGLLLVWGRFTISDRRRERRGARCTAGRLGGARPRPRAHGGQPTGRRRDVSEILIGVSACRLGEQVRYVLGVEDGGSKRSLSAPTGRSAAAAAHEPHGVSAHHPTMGSRSAVRGADPGAVLLLTTAASVIKARRDPTARAHAGSLRAHSEPYRGAPCDDHGQHRDRAVRAGPRGAQDRARALLRAASLADRHR